MKCKEMTCSLPLGRHSSMLSFGHWSFTLPLNLILKAASYTPMRFRFFFLLSLLLGIFSSQQAFGTHIRAGEIIAERISVQTLTYRITVVEYTDTRSSVIFGPGEIDFGDGRKVSLNTESDVSSVEPLGNQVEKNTFIVTH